jgi:hypothetical protein
MFSTLVDVFSVLLLEVDHGIVTDLSDEGVLIYGTLVEKFINYVQALRTNNRCCEIFLTL